MQVDTLKNTFFELSFQDINDIFFENLFFHSNVILRTTTERFYVQILNINIAFSWHWMNQTHDLFSWLIENITI